MRKALLGIAVVSAAVALPWAVTAQSPPEDVALDRIERSFGAYGWGGICFDYCGGHEFGIETPSDVSAVDVVVTATISYRLAAGQRGSATLARVTSTDLAPPPRANRLRGGSWPLRSTGGRSATVTLTWFARALPAAGKKHKFVLEYHGGSPDEDFVAETRKAVVVAEVWSAGQ
jgi:hypothetical protein